MKRDYSAISRVQAAIQAIRDGKMIVIMDDQSRENEGDLVAAAELMTNQMTNFMITEARGLLCTPLSKKRAEELDLFPMVNNNEDPYQTAFTVSVDHQSLHTGISAFERRVTINELANDNAKGHDFNRPGHIFPLIAKEGGVLTRRGHTEASVDMVSLAGLKPVAAICEILKSNGEMARETDLKLFAEQHQLIMITIQDIVDYRNFVLMPESEAYLPTAYGRFKIYCFPNRNGQEPHIALVKENTDFSQPVLTRIHSECLTGDIFHSSKCDCQAQLDHALTSIGAAQNGLLIYLRQEGRGIGLIEKIRAYALQDQGLDTIEANLSLGHEVDRRNYDEAIEIIRYFNITEVNVMTNNPDKISALEKNGINIAQLIPTPRFETADNREYLQVKENMLGHHFGEKMMIR